MTQNNTNIIIFKLWRSEAHTSACQYACIPSGGSRKESFPCLLQLLEAASSPWLLNSSSSLPSSASRSSQLSLALELVQHLGRSGS